MENIRTAMNRGAFDFITKPIDFNDLELTIDKTLSEIKILKEGIKASEELALTIREKEIAEHERKRAEQSEKFKQQFLANMSHEIRTPMNSIIGLTNLLTKTTLDEQQSKYLNVIRRSSENLLVIINDILDLSKIEAGKMDFEKTTFSLRDALDIAYQTLAFKAEEKQLDYKLIIDPACPVNLIGDPTRLTQVIINLAGNSIKFTENGFVSIEAREVSRQGNTTFIEFKIADSGIGISKENLDRIWDTFTQATSDTTRKFGGTGLGLSISRQLIELQGGKISVSSEVQKGTVFTFTIPYQLSSEATMVETEARSDYEKDELSGIKILLVEDNAFNQMVAVDTLTDLIPNVTVDIAENGIEAVEKVKGADYGVVLMDIQMPEMDGFQATKAIRALPGNKAATKIMAMTANVTTEEVAKCFEC
jgi:signal transduction histidine kinase